MKPQAISTITLDEGKKAFERLLKETRANVVDWNEAETRFQFINRLLVECLGWPREVIELEHQVDRQFADYLLGKPVSIIWEAKRKDKYFDLPVDVRRRNRQSLPSIIAVSKDASDAIKQVHEYCIRHGAEFAVVCNGSQLIAFLAIRIGCPPLEGQALVFRDLDHMSAEFPRMWQNLSPDGIAERRLYRLLTTGSEVSLPPKPSSSLMRFPFSRYKSDTQSTLSQIAELLIQDIPESNDAEEQFLAQCYCNTGALSRDSLLSRRLLTARYAALFPAEESQPRVQPAATQEKPLQIAREIITEALARRPIILLGDVGVGKTSFLKQLMFRKASEEFTNSINVYIDLGSKAALETDLRQFIVREVERQLLTKYNVDVENSDFVRGVYDSAVKRFSTSIYGKAYKGDKQKYEQKVLEMLAGKLDDRPNHLKNSIEHIAKARKRQVILILDNADQRPIQIQQDAFIVAQEFSNNWNAMVFIAIRPQAFYQSKRSGALSAYPHRVFTIAPPRPELVIEKRLKFALKISEGEIAPQSLESLRRVTINIGNLSLFLKALLYSMKHNQEIREILANITGGNIRTVIEFVVKFIGSPNIEAEKIIRIKEEKGKYLIPIHEFSKAAILGDFSHYNPDSSLAMNLFDVQYPDKNEHFLAPMILSFLMWGESPKDNDGFTTASGLTSEMQAWGFVPQQIDGKLRRLTNKRLIESTERITFEEDTTGLIGDIPFAFRITSIGMYHIKKWAGIFPYLEAMVFDTPIFDENVMGNIRPNLEKSSIKKRFDRTVIFMNYLSSVWHASNLSPSYFNWTDTIAQGEDSFQRVLRAIEKSEA